MTSMVLGLLPFGALFAIITGTELLASGFLSVAIGLLVAFPFGVYCGRIGWWLTRNSTIDSRLMACALAALLELTLLGWLILLRSLSLWREPLYDLSCRPSARDLECRSA